MRLKFACFGEWCHMDPYFVAILMTFWHSLYYTHLFLSLAAVFIDAIDLFFRNPFRLFVYSFALFTHWFDSNHQIVTEVHTESVNIIYNNLYVITIDIFFASVHCWFPQEQILTNRLFFCCWHIWLSNTIFIPFQSKNSREFAYSHFISMRMSRSLFT